MTTLQPEKVVEVISTVEMQQEEPDRQRTCCGCKYVFKRLWRLMFKKQKKTPQQKTDDKEVYAKIEVNNEKIRKLEDESVEKIETLAIIEEKQVDEVVKKHIDEVIEQKEATEHAAKEEAVVNGSVIKEEGTLDGREQAEEERSNEKEAEVDKEERGNDTVEEAGDQGVTPNSKDDAAKKKKRSRKARRAKQHSEDVVCNSPKVEIAEAEVPRGSP
ncbi:hypothetical protein GWK47_022996 [Chionoecetes opilio]|uniref:Uncharacterized protein n=1 Tax=Chionoecetes opilio TaxID=41210 RepID=A0A8J5CJX7_CHIOP|nr:hypothetical protein GWK47_022996 [Chionoecetes opilio]